MSMFRSMQNELFKYRKRKKVSLNGSVPGVPYNDYRRSRRHVAGMPHIPSHPSYNHNLYMSGSPREYSPSFNAPAVQQTEYDPYEPLGVHTPRPNNPKSARDFHKRSQESPLLFSLPAEDLTQIELLRMTMGKREETAVENESLDHYPDVTEIGDALAKLSTVLPPDHQDLVNLRTAMRDLLGFQELWPELEDSEIDTGEPFETEELTPEDVARKFLDITDALSHLQKVLPPEHPDIMNLRDAVHNILDDPETMSKLESLAGDVGPSKLGEGDPYECDIFEEAGQEFEQQIQMVEEQFSGSEMMPIENNAQDMLQDQSTQPAVMPDETLQSEPFVEEQTLEEIVQQEDPLAVAVSGFAEQNMMPDEMLPDAMPESAGYDVGMAADEINQAIDQAIETPMPQESEPDPFQPQYDPFMAPEYMFDPQMQYMPNYMMPGPMPFGPGMGPGPMGPMPGPQMM